LATTAEQQQLTEALLDTLAQTDFPSAGQLDRLERLISSREELEVYMAILMKKVEGTISPDGQLLDRLERLVRVLKRFDQERGEAESKPAGD
jgi:hypothetical protein